jgi:hypothetical protein
MTGALSSTDQVLDELEFLASAEHALITEYLTVGYALSIDLPDASGVAANLAQSQMFRLNDVCRALVAAGRSPTLDRAASITVGAADIPFSPAGPDAYADLLDRESAIARAVDDRYRGLARRPAPTWPNSSVGPGQPTSTRFSRCATPSGSQPRPVCCARSVSSQATTPSRRCSARATRHTAWWSLRCAPCTATSSATTARSPTPPCWPSTR